MQWLFRPMLLIAAVINLSFVVALVGRGGEGNPLSSEALGASSHRVLSDLTLTERVAALVESQYVDPTRVKPQDMLDKSLEQVQREIPEVMFDYDRAAGVVRVDVGSTSQKVTVGPVQTVDDVVVALRKVLGLIGQHWVPEGEVGPEDVEYTAINGFLSTLDPHSVLLPPDNAKDMDVQIQGQFGGLGITISLRGDDNILTIVSVLEETPAMRAGLRAGDQILQIDGESTVNIELEEAVSKLRGQVGSKVTILVGRKTFDEPQSFTLRRDLIRIESVESESLGDGYGYIKIKTFQHNTYQQLHAALTDLGAAGPIKGLVLDLRNNPGGPLQQAIEVADRFLEAGTIVSTVQSYTREKEVKYARRSGTEQPYPIVVMLDSDAASASEIVAGALKNNDRAVIIGETSFGKGSVQNLFPNPDDSKLKLTMLQYLTPGDQSIQSVGITPDVRLTPVYFDSEMVYLYSTAHIFRERDLESHLDGAPEDVVEQDPPIATLRYYAPEEFRLPNRHKDEEARKKAEEEALRKRQALEDFQVRFARDLLAQAGRATRRGTLNQAGPFLQKAASEQQERLSQKMKEAGIDWTAGPIGKGPLDVQLIFGDGAALTAGQKTDVTLRVTNRGTTPYFQLRGITKADLGFFDQMEFLIGRIDPGQSREWKRELHLTEAFMNVVEPVDVRVYQGDSEEVASAQTLVRVKELPHPDFAWTLIPVDDGSGASQGNGDGLIQKGETIDLLVVLKNTGEGESRKAFLKLHNREGSNVFLKTGTATFPPIAPGQYATARLNMQVRETLPDDSVELDIRAGEIGILSLPEQPLFLPVAPAAAGPAAAAQGTGQLKAATPAFASASDQGAPVAHLPAGASVAIAARSGGWVRLAIPVGAGDTLPAWVRSDALTEGAGATAAAPELSFQHWSPAITAQVANYELAQAETKLTVKVTITDDQGARSVFAFVNGKKRYFKALPEAKAAPGQLATAALSVELPMVEGINTVEIYARDAEGLQAAEVFRVYRLPALKTAQTDPGPSAR